MDKVKDFQHVTTTVQSQQESLWFYQELLGLKRAGRLYYRDNRDFIIDFMDLGNGYLLELFYFKKGLIKPTERIADDHQVGMRHIAFKVNNVDKTSEKLKKAGVEFTMEPTDALGGVRIAFFKDPSGTIIEIVEGELQYHVKGDIEGYKIVPVGDALVYDHLALTVPRIKESFNFYHNVLGFPHLGKLVFNDKDGFEIDYFQVGKAVIELFSYKVPTIPYKRNPDDTHLGLRHYGFLVDKVDPVMLGLKSQGVPILNPPVDALGGVRTCFFADPDGNALELIDGTCTYDE
jgi:catechol 2,3-dioxygenase-like lactoylglutathione lyase family enzyme